MTPTIPAASLQEGDVIVTRPQETRTVDHIAAVACDYSPDDEVTILPRPLTTIADLEATPYGTIVLDAVGEPALHEDAGSLATHGWYRFGDTDEFPSQDIPLPATVLWTPEEQS